MVVLVEDGTQARNPESNNPFLTSFTQHLHVTFLQVYIRFFQI